VKKIDKLKRQRYEIEMNILNLETKQSSSKLTKNEEKELEILQNKAEELNIKIESFSQTH